ncbi:DNA polymerase III subunit alpha, partial [candidate division KSB1 bacterium]
GAAKISSLINKTKELGMKALAITDHGNMFGVLKFFNEARCKGIKPVIGCEIYVAAKDRFSKTSKADRSGYHLILLAKNKEGYRNLSRLSSLGYLQGFYYTPRIDKELLKKYSEGLIASSACLGGEIPDAIMNKGEVKAEEALKEYLEIFGDDFYLELQNHNLPEQQSVNEVLQRLSKKYNVKLIATNDVHYVNASDYDAHQILICLNTGSELEDTDRMHYTGQEYLKSPEEMAALFPENPEALSNTMEVLEKIEDYNILEDKIILPTFPLPEKFKTEDDYLRYLTYKGAEKLYPELTPPIKERIDFELSVITDMGFAGYFLIVQDFINMARKMGVMVGPGRGSAAGSAVAYCTRITNIDPIKYKLLFERFLNPERISMPDIDVDFDDEGREKVLDYVVKKYGEKRVAQIVTFGTMAARLSIRDVARVLKVPLPEADRLAKLVPEGPKVSLEKAYNEVKELTEARDKGKPEIQNTLKFAQILEGSARQTGTHACGVIIGPDDLIDHVPLSTAKDSKLSVTQYEGKLVESVGMLKMDFLGLKTLSIIKDAIDNIEKRHGFKIDVDVIPLNDEKTFELYQKGETVGTFQFESDGMRNYLKELKPTCLEDLIAMNALYRPGPMNNIPYFINRKHGRDKVLFPHDSLKDILENTYGIMVYQEQIMQISQRMAGFSGGKADELRKAMGKKNMEIIEKLKVEFVEGAVKNEIDEKNASEVYDTMAKFGEYGFNRSHSAAYSIIAYQTAYLKANYPAEYMASVLTHNLSDIKKITFFIEESHRQNIPVLGPDINESDLNFTVNKNGEVRFGLAAIKGVGEAAAKFIIQEREENGQYKNIIDLTKRISLRSVNKRSLEALAMAGGFDSFSGTHRAQYFYKEQSEDQIFLEKVIKHAVIYQERQNRSQHSLFGESEDIMIPDIKMPECEPWTKLEQLRNEKEVTGFYMSGHPLDDYKVEISQFCNVTINELNEHFNAFKNKEIVFAGIVTEANHKTTKSGRPFGSFRVEDFTDSIQLALFAEDYLKMKHFLIEETTLLIKARIQYRYNSEDQLEIRVNNISLLADALDNLSNNLTLQLQLDALSEKRIEELYKMIKKNKGNCKLKVRVIDKHEGNVIELPSKQFRVKCSEMVNDIKNQEQISFKVN